MASSTKACVIHFILLMGIIPLYAQNDTTYFVTFPKRITTRFYFSQKYNSLTIQNREEGYRVRYYPNTTVNMGVGATYRWFTLNLAYGWAFLNHDGDKGKTNYLDLQFHGFSPKYNLDILAASYTGFYANPHGTMPANQYYQRPDLNVVQIGASLQYVVNHRRFSFRASTLQSEWQKKSAGTFLAGMEGYGGAIRSDSSYIPVGIHPIGANFDERSIRFFQLGINGGYAYTVVISEHVFLTGQAAASISYGYHDKHTVVGSLRQSGFTMNTLLRFCAGYNSDTWGLSLVYVNTGVNLAGGASPHAFTINAGNLRLNYIYRFKLGRKPNQTLENVIQ